MKKVLTVRYTDVDTSIGHLALYEKFKKEHYRISSIKINGKIVRVYYHLVENGQETRNN